MPTVFASAWATLGTSRAAVTDGGKWPTYDEFNHGDGTQLLAVVDLAGRRALRIQQRGSGYAANLQAPTAVPPSTDYTLTFWFRNDDTSAAGDHTVTPDIYQYEHLTYVRKFSSPSTWNLIVSAFGGGYVYPIGHWHLSTPLFRSTWYRLEYLVHFVDPTHMQVRPRVWSEAGVRLFDEANFQQSDPGSAQWEGRSDWTLGLYYQAGHSFQVDPKVLTTIGVGNNGQQGAEDTRKFWYIADLQISTGVVIPPPILPPPGTLPSGTYTLPAGTKLIIP